MIACSHFELVSQSARSHSTYVLLTLSRSQISEIAPFAQVIKKNSTGNSNKKAGANAEAGGKTILRAKPLAGIKAKLCMAGVSLAPIFAQSLEKVAVESR